MAIIKRGLELLDRVKDKDSSPLYLYVRIFIFLD